MGLQGSPGEERQRWRGGPGECWCAPVTHHTLQRPARSESHGIPTLTDVVERTRNSFPLEPKCAAGPILAKFKVTALESVVEMEFRMVTALEALQ